MPFLLGTFAWGAVFGGAAVLAGLNQGFTLAMSAAVWSGTAQLAVLKILALPLLSMRREWSRGGLASYLIGAWLAQYTTWIGGTAAGALFGSVVPRGSMQRPAR